MSVNGQIIGIPAGAGQSFPMAGVRPKVRKSMLFTSSGVWVAPVNVYFAEFTLCGGGGGASVTYYGGQFSIQGCNSGAGASASGPGIASVVPGSAYIVTVGAGGAGGTQSVINGGTGGTSSVVGPLLILRAPGGAGALYSTSTAAAGGTIDSSALGGRSYAGGAGALRTSNNTTSGAVQHSLPGNILSVTHGETGVIVLNGGGASLYSPGGAAGNTAVTPAFGAGGGAVLGANPVAGTWHTGSSGGNGFVRVSWEE